MWLPVVAQLSKKGSQSGEVISITELEAWAWLRILVSRLKSGGELPPFLTRSIQVSARPKLQNSFGEISVLLSSRESISS